MDARALIRAFFTADGSVESPVESPWDNRRALLSLVPLGCLFLVVMAYAPWWSNMDVDTLTHFFQVRAVADHGSIGFDNGPVTGNPELTPRWLIPARGLAWGTYPAVMPYLLALPMKLGGFRGVIRALWMLYALACLGVYGLTYRVTRRPVASVAAAYSLGVASQLWLWATMLAPFVPVAALGVWSVYFASRGFSPDNATDPRRRLGYAALAGLLSSLALGCHLLWAIVWGLLGLCMLGGRTPFLQRIERGAAYGIASVPALAWMSWVNHLRFGTWNPVSYGPCNLGGCLGGTVADNPQNGGEFIATFGVLRPYLVALLVAMYLVRRSPRAMAVLVGTAAVGALVPETQVRDPFFKLAKCAWQYLVDAGHLDVGFPRFGNRLGSYSDFWMYSGPWCIRGLLQCSPVLIAAGLARGDVHPRSEDRAAFARMAWSVFAGVLMVVLMRAGLEGGHAYGLSFVNHRYMVPLLPAVTVLAFSAMGALPWRPWHAALALAVALAGGHALYQESSDNDLLRRQVTLFLPLAMAFGLGTLATAAKTSTGASARALSHVTALLAALCVGYGGAIVYGVDWKVAMTTRRIQDSRTEELARCTSQRFILMGGYALDEAAPIADRRDVMFVNVGMGPRDGSNARRIVGEAMSDDRPAFLVQDRPEGNWFFNWPGYEFRRVEGCPRVWRLHRLPASR